MPTSSNNTARCKMLSLYSFESIGNFGLIQTHLHLSMIFDIMLRLQSARMYHTCADYFEKVSGRGDLNGAFDLNTSNDLN